MKLLLDQGFGRSVANLLSEHGYEATHVADLGLSAASDDDILATARGMDAVVVTLDKDFHELLAQSGARWPSVVLLRETRGKSLVLARVIAAACDRHAALLSAGAAVSVRSHASRARPLPLRESR